MKRAHKISYAKSVKYCTWCGTESFDEGCTYINEEDNLRAKAEVAKAEAEVAKAKAEVTKAEAEKGKANAAWFAVILGNVFFVHIVVKL